MLQKITAHLTSPILQAIVALIFFKPNLCSSWTRTIVAV